MYTAFRTRAASLTLRAAQTLLSICHTGTAQGIPLQAYAMEAGSCKRYDKGVRKPMALIGSGRTLAVGANRNEYEVEDYYEGAEFDDEQGTATDRPEHKESDFETTTVRCCGAACCIILGICGLAWLVHAIPVATISDVPNFARSMIWMSLAHHTDQWQNIQKSYSPPPPAFGDGRGHFPDRLVQL